MVSNLIFVKIPYFQYQDCSEVLHQFEQQFLINNKIWSSSLASIPRNKSISHPPSRQCIDEISPSVLVAHHVTFSQDDSHGLNDVQKETSIIACSVMPLTTDTLQKHSITSANQLSTPDSHSQTLSVSTPNNEIYFLVLPQPDPMATDVERNVAVAILGPGASIWLDQV